jgi:hypothetical protein
MFKHFRILHVGLHRKVSWLGFKSLLWLAQLHRFIIQDADWDIYHVCGELGSHLLRNQPSLIISFKGSFLDGRSFSN